MTFPCVYLESIVLPCPTIAKVRRSERTKGRAGNAEETPTLGSTQGAWLHLGTHEHLGIHSALRNEETKRLLCWLRDPLLYSRINDSLLPVLT